MDFKTARSTDVWMGRHNFSQHNTSSPDMMFRNFSSSVDTKPTK
jgi:hypothetical protein